VMMMDEPMACIAAPNVKTVNEVNTAPHQHCLKITAAKMELIYQGAEAKVFGTVYLGKPAIVKERQTKSYRVPALDLKINRSRLLQEMRSSPPPPIFCVVLKSSYVYLLYL
jgi:hypothetical protein